MLTDLKKIMHYERLRPPDLRVAAEREEDGVLKRIVTYQTAFGIRRAALLLQPAGEAQPDEEVRPAILYVHWYEPEAVDSNRKQFEPEALKMAAGGAVCLLVETMWSDLDWFIKRRQEDDWDLSIRQTVELRQAMDLLLAQPGVDSRRCAYVGHDFGAMYGILMGSVDPRPCSYVLMAPTARFSDWYLYYPRLEGEARRAFIEQMDPIDPVRRVADLAPAPLLFQFGTQDPHVPVERANELFEAAGEPKQVCWYESGHGLNPQAEADRTAWLAEKLGLEVEG